MISVRTRTLFDAFGEKSPLELDRQLFVFEYALAFVMTHQQMNRTVDDRRVFAQQIRVVGRMHDFREQVIAVWFVRLGMQEPIDLS